jgi:NADP-dependent 3-hydroxy acid dehydrogenase YdfG
MTSAASPDVVVVVGGTGVVGAAVVEQLLADGLRVVAPTRSASGPDGARVVPAVDWEHPESLRNVLREPGWRPRAVVAAIGGWWMGPDLMDVEPATWRRLLESHLTAHWLAARALAPLLCGEDPTYVMVAGAAATDPMPGSGPINVTGAAQRMLLHVLRAEEIGQQVRFCEVNVRAAVRGDGRNLDPAESVEREAVAATVRQVIEDGSSPAVVEVTPA